MPWRWLAVLLVALWAAPLPAWAQEEIGQVEASERDLEVGGVWLVRVGPYAELVNLDQAIVGVAPAGPGQLRVEGRRNGDAVVLVLRPDGRLDQVVIRVVPNARAAVAPPSVAANVPILSYQGALAGVVVADTPVALSTLHSVGYRHERPGETWANLARVTAARQAGAPSWSLPIAFLHLQRPTASLRLGDAGVVLAEGISMAAIRGIQATWRPQAGVGEVSTSFGPTTRGCCSFVDPEGDVVFALGGAVATPSGLASWVGAGLLAPREGGAVRYHWKVGFAGQSERQSVRTELAQVGDGLGMTAGGTWRPSERAEVDVNFQGAQRGLYAPPAGPLESGTLLGRVAAALRPTDWARLQPISIASRRGATPDEPRTDQVTAGLLSELQTDHPFVFDLGYLRSKTYRPGEPDDGAHTGRLGMRTPLSFPLTWEGFALASWAEGDGALRTLLASNTALLHPGNSVSFGPRAFASRSEQPDSLQDWIGGTVRAAGRRWQVDADAGWWRVRDDGDVLGGPQWDVELGLLPGHRARLDLLASGAHLPGVERDLLRGDVLFSVEGPARAPTGLGLGGRVEGIVFHDRDADGFQDEGEPGIPGIEVEVFERTATSDDRGVFRVSGLPPGPHEIEVSRRDWHSVDGIHREVMIAGWARTRVQFALSRGAAVQVRIFQDDDRDGRHDREERGVTAETVRLVAADGTERRFEAPQGLVVMEGVARGTYEVQVDPLGLPPGYRPVGKLDQQLVVDAAGALQVQVPLWAHRAVGGRVWVDVNGNGSFDGADEPAVGVVVSTTSGSRTTTDTQGYYLFRDVAEKALVLRTEGAQPRAVSFPNGPAELLREDLVVSATGVPSGVVAPAQRPVALRVSPQSVFLRTGQTVDMSAVSTSGALDQADVTGQVDFEVADPDIAAVEGRALRGLRTGSTTVHASYLGVRAPDVPVEVVEIPLTELAARPAVVSVELGQSAALLASARYATGEWMDATTLTQWRSRDPQVASVDERGVVRAVSPGTATIEGTLGDLVLEPVQVRVTLDQAQPRSVSIHPGITLLSLDGEGRLDATLTLVDGRATDGLALVTWEVEDPTLVEVLEGGRLRPLAPGETRVTATWRGVRSLPATVTIAAPVGLFVRTPPGMIPVGARIGLTAAAVLEQGATRDVTGAAWEIEDPGVARVDGAELVALAPGTTTVAAVSGDLRSMPVPVTVVQGPLATLRPTHREVRVAQGEAAYVDLVAGYSDGPSGAVPGARWSIADPAVARIDEGRVSGLTVGQTTAVAVWLDRVSEPMVIVVEPPQAAPRAVRIAGAGATIPLAGRRRLVATATLDGDRTATATDAQWEVDDASVLEVDGQGLVRPLAAGRARVTATWRGVSSAPVTLEVLDAVGLVLGNAPPVLPVGVRLALHAEAIHTDGTVQVLPQGASTCQTSGGDVVRVDGRGELLAVRAGTARITCSWRGIDARPLDLRVVDLAVSRLDVDPPRIGTTAGRRVSARVFATLGEAARGERIDVTELATWTVTDPRVADATPRGEIITFSAGTVDLVPSWQGVSASPLTVRVVSDNIEALVLEGRAPAILAGSSARLRATATHADGSSEDLSMAVSWWTSDPNGLAIDASGLAQGLVPGRYTVHASAGSLTAGPMPLRVVDRQVQGIRIDAAGLAPFGQTPRVLRVEVDTPGGWVRIPSEQVRWDVDGQGVTVDASGQVRVAPGGTARVSAHIDRLRSSPVTVSSGEPAP